MGQLSLGLGQLYLKWPGIDICQEITLLDDLTFLKKHLHQLPADKILDRDRIKGSDRT